MGMSSHKLQIIFRFILSQCPQLRARSWYAISQMKKIEAWVQSDLPKDLNLVSPPHALSWLHGATTPIPSSFCRCGHSISDGPTSLRTRSRWGIWHFLGLNKAREKQSAGMQQSGPETLSSPAGACLTLASSVRPSFTTG